MSWVELLLASELVIPIAIGILWSIQTCGIGYILIFYLLHECYIASRMKLFGITTTGIITGTSHQLTAESGDEHFVHYEFSTNPPYPQPTWNTKVKISKTYYSQCKKGEIVRIIFDPITRNSDFYYDGYRNNICSKWDAYSWLCLVIPFPITSISTAMYFSFRYDVISGISCIAFGIIMSVPVCIYLCKRRHTFCFRYKFTDSESDVGISKHQTNQDIKDTISRNHRAHSSFDMTDIISDIEVQNMINKVKIKDIKESKEEEHQMDDDDDEKVQDIQGKHNNKLVSISTDTPPNTVSTGPHNIPIRSDLLELDINKDKIHVRNGSTGIVINKYKRREYIQNIKEREKKKKKKKTYMEGNDGVTGDEVIEARSSVYLRDDLDEGYHSESKEEEIDDEYQGERANRNRIKRKKRVRQRSEYTLKNKNNKRKYIEYHKPMDTVPKSSTHYKSVSLNTNNNPFIDDGISRLRKIKWSSNNDINKDYHNENEGRKEDFADNEHDTMTLTVTQTTTATETSEQSPDISPYIIDDGTASFTADTFEIYKDTSVKSMFNKNNKDKRASNKSKKSRTSSNILSGKVITPIPIRYLTGANTIHRHIYNKNISNRRIDINKYHIKSNGIYKNKKDKDNDILYQNVHAVIKTASV